MAIRIQNISKSYENQDVFSNFSLDLPDRGCVCLFGPSGCGKTTLLQLICGLIEPDEGSIAISPGRRISYVFQEDRLLPWITALQNVELVLDADPKNAREDALTWLHALGLSDFADKLPGNLSGGMRQRVSLARAFAFGGDILLLDEPFQGIDAQAKENIFKLIDEMKKNTLVILITHYPEEAVRLADCIHILQYPPARIAGTITISDLLREDRIESAQTIKKLAALSPMAGQSNSLISG